MDRIKKKQALRISTATGVGVLCVLGFAFIGMPGHTQSGPPQKDMTIGKIERNATIEAAIANLDKLYVYPEQAARIEQQLRTKMRQGDYDAITSAQALADTLTADLQRENHDKHLVVRYFEESIPEPSAKQDAQDKAAEAGDERHFNFGYDSVDRLHGNIGYIDLHEFSRPDRAAERIGAAMTLLGDTDALIIDLRKCTGGDPDTVMLFASYLFDMRTHLNDIYWRDENRTEARWTTDTVPGKKYGQTREVYLLTSEDTFSGCEDLAYALKYSRRATLIGEATGGGAHPGNPHRLDAHFMMFVPSGRAINPVTHTDWEDGGVVPDVKSPAKNALDIAQIAALKHLVAVESDPDWKQRLQKRIDELE
jgi:C-terminal processing protease CtpA/Prc